MNCLSVLWICVSLIPSICKPPLLVLIGEKHLLTMILHRGEIACFSFTCFNQAAGRARSYCFAEHCEALSLVADDTFPIDKCVVFCPKSLPLCKRAFLHLLLACLGLLLSKRNSVGPRPCDRPHNVWLVFEGKGQVSQTSPFSFLL